MPAHVHEPLITITLEPKSKADANRLEDALNSICATDPLLRFTVDPESGQWLLGGASEMHLDDAVSRITADGVKVNCGQPQVEYRERPTRSAQVDYTHKKHIGKGSQFARVVLRVEPMDDGATNSFEALATSHDLPPEFVTASEKGARSVLASGVLLGFPTIGTRVTLIDCAFHETNSSVLAFEIAARMAMREALQKSGVRLLEPFVDVVVMTPPESVERIVVSTRERRSDRLVKESLGDTRIIRFEAPLATMSGFYSTLRHLSGGRATYSMMFNRYQELPNHRRDDDPDRDGPAVAMKW